MTLSQKLTIELIRYELFGGTIDTDANFDDALIGEIYSFANEQDVVYIVASALSKLGLLSGENKAIFFNEQLGSIYRNEQFLHDMEFITSVLENNQIAYIPLKGAIIKQYYPKPEMRTSCDIDVLIHEADLQNALDKLYAAGCVYVSECSHDVMLSTPAGTYLELHFTLNEYEFKADELLNDAWEYADSTAGYRYDFENEFFIFYHIAHIARHMYTGGCGLRPFIDLKIILDNFKYGEIILNEMLKKSDLMVFYQNVLCMISSWLSGKEKTKVASELENYIFSSGIYGNMENKIAVINEKNGSKSKYMVSIFFPSYKAMKKRFTILNKLPVLLPFLYVVRWIESIFKGRFVNALNLVTSARNVTSEKQRKVNLLLNDLGLK